MSTSVTIPQLAAWKREGRRLSMITAYDFPSARLATEAGIDLLLVGDSLGTTVQGRPTTLEVTLDESLYHTRLVSDGVATSTPADGRGRPLVIGDLPFGSYQRSTEQAVASSIRYLKEAGASAVKFEGGAHVEAAIRAVTAAQIPVLAHIGLTPQSVHMFGGYKVQRVEEQLIRDAEIVQAAGAFAVVLEGIPGVIAAQIQAKLQIPTIGIGAGVECDGQVLVWHDLLGLTDRAPKFVKAYADLNNIIRSALRAFRDEVESATFPTDEHTYH